MFIKIRTELLFFHYELENTDLGIKSFFLDM